MLIFPTPGSALAFYHSANPARAKYFNLLEPENGSKPIEDTFDLSHPHRCWAAVVCALKRTMNGLNGRERKAFKAYYLEEKGPHRMDVAKAMGVSKRTVDYWLENGMKLFKDELINRQLMVEHET